MSTIGLDSLYFAPITESASGQETYGTPIAAPGAQSADIKLNINEGKNYADDGTWEVVKEFIDGTITLGVAQLGTALAAMLVGATVDGNGVLISSAENAAPPVAVGFRSLRSDHSYEYVWLYRVTFSAPGHTYNTKAESVSFQNDSIEGNIQRRRKPDAYTAHPWRAHADQRSVAQGVIDDWFDAVYEPGAGTVTISAQPADATVTAGSITGSLSVTAAVSAGTAAYQWYQSDKKRAWGGSEVASGTAASLTIPTTLAAGKYYYYCVVSGTGCSRVSDVATVTVNAGT